MCVIEKGTLFKKSTTNIAYFVLLEPICGISGTIISDFIICKLQFLEDLYETVIEDDNEQRFETY